LPCSHVTLHPSSKIHPPYPDILTAHTAETRKRLQTPNSDE
jgi:hypothetical protein